MAKGHGVTAFEYERSVSDTDRLGGEMREGESGELGDGDVDFEVIKRKVGPLEGDRESERLNCMKAEDGSTWWMCVGEGKCKVPPVSPCGEYEATISVCVGVRMADVAANSRM